MSDQTRWRRGTQTGETHEGARRLEEGGIQTHSGARLGASLGQPILPLPSAPAPAFSRPPLSLLLIMANPNVQKVPKLMLQFNDWQAAGKIDKAQNNALNGTATATPQQHNNQRPTLQCGADTREQGGKSEAQASRSLRHVATVNRRNSVPSARRASVESCTACLCISRFASLLCSSLILFQRCTCAVLFPPALVLSYNDAVLALADEIGTTAEVRNRTEAATTVGRRAPRACTQDRATRSGRTDIDCWLEVLLMCVCRMSFWRRRWRSRRLLLIRPARVARRRVVRR